MPSGLSAKTAVAKKKKNDIIILNNYMELIKMIGITNATETRRFFPSIYKRGDLCTFLSGGWANNTDVDGYSLSYGTGTLRGNISYYNTHVAF